MLKNKSIVAAIEALLPVLEGARMRPQFYFQPIEPNTLIHWLWGLRTGYKLFKVDCPTEHWNKAMKRHRLKAPAISWGDDQLLARGLTPEQVVQEMLAIEIEMWQAYRDQLTTSP